MLAKVQGSDLTLANAHEELKTDAMVRLKGQRHDITTNKGVVQLLDDAINAFLISDDIVGRQELNTLGYVCGIQLKAIAAVQEEAAPTETIADLLGNGTTMTIKMTKEERKLYLTAGSVEKMTQVLQAVKNDGRVIELREQADGSYSAPPMEAPPKMDAQMPITTIRQAMAEEGSDITRGEVLEIFGTSLGAVPEVELEEFGFEEVFAVNPRSEPLLGHSFQQITVENSDMPGVVVRRSKCTKCGITTGNTSKLVSEECKELG